MDSTLLRRWIWSLKSWLRSSTGTETTSPVDAEAVIEEARLQDQHLRNRAATAIAEKVVLSSRIKQDAAAAGEARALARHCLFRSDEARAAGDEDTASKWAEEARTHAAALQVSEHEKASLQSRYREAWETAERAKAAIRENASELRDLSRERPEASGRVETVIQILSTSIEDEAPSPDSLDDLVDRLEDDALARAGLPKYPSGLAQQESGEAVNMTQAESRLDSLRAESDR